MSRASDTCEDRLPLAAAKQINAMCNRFELAWQAGQRPQIEDYLADAPEPLRSALVRELVALEIAYRRRAGEEPTAAEYRVRFPTLSLATLLTDPVASVCGLGSGDTAALPAVPGYELLQELGRGGMGVVYLARQGALDRTVALKMILTGGHAGPAERERFRTEGEAIARLQHPNIVQIHEVGDAGGHPYCALEFVAGGSLAGKLAGQHHLEGDGSFQRQVACLVHHPHAAAAEHAEYVVAGYRGYLGIAAGDDVGDLVRAAGPEGARAGRACKGARLRRALICHIRLVVRGPQRVV